MNRKDIALTTLGVVSTMVLAYLLYRMQQRDAAAAAASSQAASNAAADALPYQAEAYSDPYSQAIASLSTTPTTTANTPAAVSSSGATADTGATGTSIDGNDTNNLMQQIIAAFAGSITTPAPAPSGSSPLESVASMTIPTIAGVQASALTGIPLTAQDAAASSGVPAAVYESPGGSGPGYYPGGSPGGPPSFIGSMQTGFDVSSHPVTPHPILSSGAA